MRPIILQFDGPVERQGMLTRMVRAGGDPAAGAYVLGRQVAEADVVNGGATPICGEGAVAWELKRSGALCAQPPTLPKRQAANALNEAANARLLSRFGELAA